jgi:hypothetical protein
MTSIAPTSSPAWRLSWRAGAFNRRHKRVGHLFQNRYKSIVVEAEAYLLELVRYVHLNPLRAKAVPDLRRLGHYPWTGHSALLGTVPRPWQDTRTILSLAATPSTSSPFTSTAVVTVSDFCPDVSPSREACLGSVHPTSPHPS